MLIHGNDGQADLFADHPYAEEENNERSQAVEARDMR